ncbi:proteinase-activated receptor 4-like isoform X3 [Mobula birostris]|uniref:proteinase-activated receptor 4-like isoform X3 n=1 Tax=Mobula birostris TaxID=1983395 RepID=UPI003B28020A
MTFKRSFLRKSTHEGLSEGNVHEEIRCSCGRIKQEGSVSLQSEKEYWFHSLRGSSLKPFCLGLPHKLNSETVWSCCKMNCSILLRAILLCVFWSRQEANRSLDYDVAACSKARTQPEDTFGCSKNVQRRRKDYVSLGAHKTDWVKAGRDRRYNPEDAACLNSVMCGGHRMPDYNDTESIVSEIKAETRSVPSVSDIMRGYKPNEHRANGSNETIYTVTGTVRNQLTGLTTTVTIPGLYVLVFTIGLPANGLGLWVLATKIRKLPSTIFLISLATADLLLILMLPFKISYHLLGNNWLFGEALCRTTTAFFYGNMYCSILLLTVISIDRYFALVYPFTSRQFRDNAFAISVCSAIWVIAALLVLPFLFKEQLLSIDNLNITTCHDVLPVDSQAGVKVVHVICCRKEQRGLLSGRTTQELLNTHTYTSHSRAGMSVKDV